MTDAVIVYGSLWCGFTQRMLLQLQKLGIAHRFVDIDEEPEAAKRIAEWNNNRIVRPTLVFQGYIFFNPDPATLPSELTTRGFLEH